MKRNIALLCMSLAACSESAAIEDAVRESLIDPESARFGEIVQYTDEGNQLACVIVNAKNRMGGYTGDSIIIAQQDSEGDWYSARSGPEGYSCADYIETFVTKPDE